MSKGLGKLQSVALSMSEDGVTLITPALLASKAFETESPTDSQIRSSRRALQVMAKNGLIFDHGFSGGHGHKLYGGPHAKKAVMESLYRKAMAQFSSDAK